jgi:hypothetical protein
MAVPIAPAVAPIAPPETVRCSVLLIFEQPAIANVAAMIAIIFFMFMNPLNVI